jgi:hypothetical protein
MPVNLVSEDEIRSALMPYRADPAAFEAGVRARVAAAEKEQAADPLASWSPFLRAAAAFLPLELLTGCKAIPAAAKLAPAGGAYKVISYLAYPAISMFVLLGAAVFSVSRIRSIQDRSGPGLSNQAEINEAMTEWQMRPRGGEMAVFAVSLLLMFVGASWILFLFYLVSFGFLLVVLDSLAKLRLGNRQLIGRTCGMGLMFLGQGAMMSGIGYGEIHFLDQQLVSAVFLGGVLILLPFSHGGFSPAVVPIQKTEKTPRWFWVGLAVFWLVQLGFIGFTWSMPRMSVGFRAVITVILVVGALGPVASMVFKAALARRQMGSAGQSWAAGLMVTLLVPLILWQMSSILLPATPERIKHYVESFDRARFSSASWHKWEIVARWAIDAKLAPDLSKPRRLLAEEMGGKQNPYILSSAMRVGLLTGDEAGQSRDYEQKRRWLLTDAAGIKPQSVHLGQYDWVVRTAVARDDLSSAERDLLAQRLLATLEGMASDQYAKLETALRVTQLLSVIERPIDRNLYQGKVHDLLREFHGQRRWWRTIAGGFRSYRRIAAGDLQATAHAIELMETYGVPADLDLRWTQSFLRPLASRKISDEQWVAAAALGRLNRLPGVPQPTWMEVLYYERSLLAAMVLVGLCVYATLRSPKGPKDSGIGAQVAQDGRQKSEVRDDRAANDTE